jgi:hypothetical protein
MIIGNKQFIKFQGNLQKNTNAVFTRARGKPDLECAETFLSQSAVHTQIFVVTLLY